MKKPLQEFENLRWRSFLFLTLGGEALLLCALFGRVISGVESGLTIRNGGAIDGVAPKAFVTISDVADMFKSDDRGDALS